MRETDAMVTEVRNALAAKQKEIEKAGRFGHSLMSKMSSRSVKKRLFILSEPPPG